MKLKYNNRLRLFFCGIAYLIGFAMAILVIVTTYYKVILPIIGFNF